MNTSKYKAEQLVRKYYTFGLNNPAQSFSWYECQQCALIAVDEMLDFITKYDNHWLDYVYWEEVKSEIEKL